MYDYSRLKGRIIEVCGTQNEFAKQMELSTRTISLKINQELDWKQREIQKAIAVLEIPQTEIASYFFRLKVQGV